MINGLHQIIRASRAAGPRGQRCVPWKTASIAPISGSRTRLCVSWRQKAISRWHIDESAQESMKRSALFRLLKKSRGSLEPAVKSGRKTPHGLRALSQSAHCAISGTRSPKDQARSATGRVAPYSRRRTNRRDVSLGLPAHQIVRS